MSILKTRVFSKHFMNNTSDIACMLLSNALYNRPFALPFASWNLRH